MKPESMKNLISMMNISILKEEFLQEAKIGTRIESKKLLNLQYKDIIKCVTGGYVPTHHTLQDIKLQYFEFECDKDRFESLTKNQNHSLIYKNVKIIENEFNKKIFQKISRMKWTIDASEADNIYYFQYYFDNYTLERIKYLKKYPTDNIKIIEYENYIHEVTKTLYEIHNNAAYSETIMLDASPGSKYYRADALSMLIRFRDDNVKVLRFNFLNKQTSIVDQGTLASFFASLFYLIFEFKHSPHKGDYMKILAIISQFVSDNKLNAAVKEIVDLFEQIDEIKIFREPKIGKVFNKTRYRYEVNHFYLHTLHSKEGLDISKGDLIEDSIMVREQEIALKNFHNHHDKCYENVCYFNYILLFMNEDVELNTIPIDLLEVVMNTVDSCFFYFVISQQMKMVSMIENRLKNSFTKKIKSCIFSPLDIAHKKLNQLIENQKRGGTYRLKNEEYELTIKCLKQWINILKYHKFIKNLKKLKYIDSHVPLTLKNYQYHFDYLNKSLRINPGAGFFYEMMNKDDFCSNYIYKEFSTIIPWFNWRDDLSFVKYILMEKIGISKYKENKYDLDIFLETIFGNKSFLYKQNASGRAVFYESIEKQFDDWAKYENLKIQSNQFVDTIDILKTSVITKAKNTLKEFGLKSGDKPKR